MRTIILLLLLHFSVAVAAQSHPDELKKATNTFNEIIDYLQKAPTPSTHSYINGILPKFKNEVAFIDYLACCGNEEEKKLGHFYSTIVRFRLGYQFSGLNSPDTAFVLYSTALFDADSLLKKDVFPVKYQLDGNGYNFDDTYFNMILPVLYVDMARVSLQLSGMEQAEKYSRRAIACKNISNYDKYRATVFLISCLEKKKDEKEMLAQTLSLWKLIKLLDTARQREINVPDAEIMKRVKYLADKIYATENNWATPGGVAKVLMELNKNEEAEAFLKLVLQKNASIELEGFDDDFYYNAMMNAYKFDDKDVMKWASYGLAASYLLPPLYVRDLIMVLKLIGDREYAKIIKKRYKK